MHDIAGEDTTERLERRIAALEALLADAERALSASHELDQPVELPPGTVSAGRPTLGPHRPDPRTLLGVADGPGASAVLVDAPDGHGATLSGGRSKLRLPPAGLAPNLRADPHQQGEIILDTEGNLWLCVQSGTPGRWQLVSGPLHESPLETFDNPVRGCDSRPGEPPHAGEAGRKRRAAPQDPRVNRELHRLDHRSGGLLRAHRTTTARPAQPMRASLSGQVVHRCGARSASEVRTASSGPAGDAHGRTGSPRAPSQRRARMACRVTLVALLVVLGGCSGSKRIALDNPSPETLAPGERFVVKVSSNASIGDQYTVLSVENARADGTSYEDESDAAGAGSTTVFHFIAGDAPGPGKVTLQYCYRGCGGDNKDRPDRQLVASFTVQNG